VGLLVGLIAGAVGTGYLIYGKRQYSARFAIAGVLLMIYPYFLSNAFAIVATGAALILAPFAYDRIIG